MESCGMSFIKYLLFIFNLFFCISGIGIIVAGAVVLADVGEFSHFMESRILAPPVVLIVAGAIVFFVAFLGCFGAIRESYKLLITFAVFLGIIFIIEFAVGIAAAVYKNDFQVALKETLKTSMKNYTNDADKLAWDNVQTKLMCCGVDGAEDWAKNQLSVPYSCCHQYQQNSEKPSQFCTPSQTEKKYLTNTGCYEKLQMKAESCAKVLIGVGIGIAFVEVIGIILACWLAMTIKKENGK